MNLDFSNVLEQIGILVENLAKLNLTKNHSVKTGVLRNSVKHEVISSNEVLIGTNTEYGIYVELGTGLFAENGDGRKDVPWHYLDAKGEWHSTVGQHPKPWLIPALKQSEDEITLMVLEEVNAQLEKAISGKN